MRFLTAICFILLFVSCKEESKSLSAQQIIDKTIENAGGDNYNLATINFTFRKTKYRSKHNKGIFEYSRTFTDSIGEVNDVLNNDGFTRFVNAQKINLPDSTATKYSNSVNSVIYFVQLPFGLNAPSVKKKVVGEAEIDGENYYEIQVTFTEQGGGADHEDVYMYWINQENFTVDYFAYKFFTDQGGIRFRKAYNPRMVNGIRIVDYENYKLEPWENVDLKTLDELYEAGKLELLSKIETEDVSVINSKE
ncbi:deoxyribose-phosphate aldolase [Aequorivita sp. SDUM287046]|uniref:Deoxyribose-phosphate aldolase n=1 Tax=Aequorivita aurantiaca TaxID=3053356 RepID=A0ABT8DLW7_9FLAO|nr:DUF6503 family protein [Aequorivita aurantiaca]MDN3724971.1 deoxyribose-phosphate aldolase [Aequorivita aurantiaca]